MGISTSDGNYHEDPLDFYSGPITPNSEASKSMTHSEPIKGPAQKPLLPAAADALKGFNDTLGDLMTGRVDPASEEGIRKITPITASTMGMGMLGAEEGALGIFGGIQGMSRKPEQYIEPLRKYTDMVLGAGEKPSNFELHNATGLWEGLEGAPRFHIDASKSKLLLEDTVDLSSSENGLKMNLNKEVPLHELLDFPELYKHYPELKNMPVGPTKGFGYHGSYNPDSRTIEMSRRTPEEFHSTLIHEIQHAVQHIENHAFGGNPDMFAPKNMGTIHKLLNDRQNELKEEIVNRVGFKGNPWDIYYRSKDIEKSLNSRFTDPEVKEGLKKLQQHPDLIEALQEIHGHAETLDTMRDMMFNMYQKLGGEVESRNAQAWAVGKDPRSNIKPFETEEYPREEQILSLPNPE